MRVSNYFKILLTVQLKGSKMKGKNIIEYLKLYILLTLFYLIIDTNGGAKYLIIVFIISTLSVIYFKKKNRIIMLTVLLPNFFYVCYGLMLSIMSDNFSLESIKQSLFYLIPGLLAVNIYLYTKESIGGKIIAVQFWSLITIYTQGSIYTLWESGEFAESHFAFIFGIYVLLFYYQKKHFNMWIAVIFTVFANKRIVIVALLFAGIVYGILKLTKLTNKNAINYIASLTTIGSYIYVILIRDGILSEFITRYQINTQGRVNVWSNFIQNDSKTNYFGEGIGWVAEKLSLLNISSYDNLHNDILGSYVELGAVGFIIWILLHFTFMKKLKLDTIKNEKIILLVSIYVYTFIIYATDNIKIYTIYWLPLFLIIFYLSNFKQSKEIE